MDDKISDIVEALKKEYPGAMTAIYRRDSEGKLQALELFLKSELKNIIKNLNVEKYNARGTPGRRIVWKNHKYGESGVWIWLGKDVKWHIYASVSNEKKKKDFTKYCESKNVKQGQEIQAADIKEDFPVILENVKKGIKSIEGFLSKRKYLNK